MAVTKNHPINSTLKKAIEYICNPDKTDGTLLIDSYGCTPETADIEFSWTHKKANKKSAHLARHLIQSFSPGETTPEQAHEIGKRLADEILGGKYEYILSTHIDRGHIHNHIIFNDVNFVDYKHSHINKKWYYDTRKISDRLCEEYGLSVIPQNDNKGKSYIEYTAAKQGTSYKAQLKADIDKAVRKSLDYSDFLLRMEIAGYEVKKGKYISFRAAGRERFVRGKTLGGYYTEDSIKERIAKNAIHRPKKENRRINLIIDIQNCIKAQESKGCLRVPEKLSAFWEEEEQRSASKIRQMTDLRETKFATTRAIIYNLKQAAKTLNFLTENNLTTYEDLETAANKIHSDFDNTAQKIKAVEKTIGENAILIKQLEIYRQYRPIYLKLQKVKNKEGFTRKFQRELILYEAAERNLKGKNPPPLETLIKDNKELSERKAKLYDEYKKLKSKSAEIEVIRSNVDTLLNRPKERNPEIEK